MADQWAEGCVTGAHELHVEVLKKRIYLTCDFILLVLYQLSKLDFESESRGIDPRVSVFRVGISV